MDPFESVKAYRQSEGDMGRAVRVSPPPPMASTLTVVPEPDPAVEVEPAGQALPGGGDAAPDAPPSAAHVPGTPRGRKRLMQVYLPGPTRALLDAARDAHGSLGAATMAALRGAYHHVVEHHTPEPVEAVGPFPAPRIIRRREHVEDARMRPIYVDPAEAAAIEQLADQCELSISELVTIAIDWFYGTAESVAPPSPPAASRRAKANA